MRGIILSAGQGSRLLPLTERMPKCLVEVGGKAILDHQLESLASAGIEEAVVIGGYRYRQIEEHLAACLPPLSVRCVFNPFWAVSSSIGSVWAAREHLVQPFCLMNGDTVFDPGIIGRASEAGASGIALLVEPLGEPVPDDMRVSAAEGRVLAVSKNLPLARTTHRSLGVVLSFAAGSDYRDMLERVIAEPNGVSAYHHAVVERLAATCGVAAIVNRSGEWQEIDRPEDIAGWRSGSS